MPKLPLLTALTVGALLLGACRAHAPAVPPPPPPVAPPPAPAAKVPPGCELNLAGPYHLPQARGWSYAVEDDGTRLTVRPRSAPDGTGPMTMVLERTPAGFVGRIEGQATTRSGRSCPVHFQAEVVACSADRIVLRSEDSRSIDENCAPVGPVPPATEKILVRD